MSNDIGTRLVEGRHPVTVEMWSRFWDHLHGGNIAQGEGAHLLSLLSKSIPDDLTLHGFIASLRTRQSPCRCPTVSRAVNIVGTGGGPPTFNISTAAAFVAAAMGIRVVKTGSRAHSSRCGSIDLLQYLRIPLAGSHDETEAMLERFGIAFAGYYVYPRELTLLARAILPLPMKAFGRFLNAVGPFLADLPVAAQLTGVSDWTLLPGLKRLTARMADRRIWFCSNALGADELISFADNFVFCTDTGEDLRISPRSLGFGPGHPSDLAPAATRDGIVDQFQAVLSGNGPSAAIETVCLNAAAVAVLAGVTWPEAVRHARDAIELGHAQRLVDAVRRHDPGHPSDGGSGFAYV